MRFNSLQFGKAMSAALFVLLLSVVGMKNALAQTQVATLQHGDDVSVFYGMNAFVEAHTAAADGDIITLSSGTFVPTTITKAITLHGAGVAVDTLVGIDATIFTGMVPIDIANSTISLNVEGIMFSGDVLHYNLTNPKFTRCSFNSIGYHGSYSYFMSNAEFVNCIINQFTFNYTRNTTFINSVIWNPTGISDIYNVIIYNSIWGNCSGYGLSAYNSIIIKDYSYYTYYQNCVFSNCIGIQLDENYYPFGMGYTTGCTTYTSYEDVFETFEGFGNNEFDFEESFLLKEEIASSVLGSDGTEVGIHGGFMPYESRPTYMVLKRCHVANRSTVDGKLSVEIEVITEGE